MADGTTITIEAQDTTFSRVGNTNEIITYTAYDYPPLNSTVPALTTITKPSFTISPRVGTLNPSGVVSARIGAANLAALVSARIGPSDLSTLITPPVGLTELAAIYGLGPLDTTYESSTEALYDRSYAIARATALSGPINVRGGTARMGFELAELDTQQSINRFREVWQNQVAWAGVVTKAIEAADYAIFEYNKEKVAAIRDSDSILTEYDNSVINATKVSNDILTQKDEELISATVGFNKVLDEYDHEVLADNEQNVMAQRANSQSSNEYYSQINAYNNTLVQRYTAGRHYGQVVSSTNESVSGQGIQGSHQSSAGGGSWR